MSIHAGETAAVQHSSQAKGLVPNPEQTLGAGFVEVPSGVMTSFRLPRFRIVKGTFTVTVCSVIELSFGSYR